MAFSSPTHSMGVTRFPRSRAPPRMNPTDNMQAQMVHVPATSQQSLLMRQPPYSMLVPTAPGQTGRLPLLSTQPPLPPNVMMSMGTPQQISSYQSLPPSLTAAPPQFQVNPSFAANTQYARIPLQNYVGLPPTMGPIGLGAAPSMQAAVMQQQQQQPAVSNYTGMQRGVGGAGGGGGGGGSSVRKPPKAIRIVDPSTMQEADLSVSGGAGGNPPPRSVSPANIPIRPPPGGAGSQPSTTAADTFRQQVLEKAQTGFTQYARIPLQNYVGLPPTMGPISLGAAPSMPAAVMQQQQQQPAVSNYTGMQRGVGGAGGGGGGGGSSVRKPLKAIRIVDPSTMQEADLSVSGGAGGNPPPRSVSPPNIPIRPPPGGAGSQPSTTTADTFRQQVLEKAQTGLIKPAPNAIIRAPKITTKSHEGVETPTEVKFGIPITISAPPPTGPPLNIPPPACIKMTQESASKLDDEPTLLELLNFDTKRGDNIDIIDEVSDKYLKFGIFLLENKTGAHVRSLVTKHSKDCESINLEIVEEWLQGRGAKPVSWRTLTRILKAVKLTVLAQDITDTLSET